MKNNLFSRLFVSQLISYNLAFDKMFASILGSENAILIEDKDESRRAAREARKLLYGAHDGCNYEDIARIVANAPKEYAKITEGWRQENFVIAVSVLYYLHDKEAQPDFLFPWLFDLLQDENGYIRHAAVRMIKNELGPLTVHIRFPREKSSFMKFLPEQADHILFTLFLSLNILATDLWKPAYKRYKYVASLPSGGNTLYVPTYYFFTRNCCRGGGGVGAGFPFSRE